VAAQAQGLGDEEKDFLGKILVALNQFEVAFKTVANLRQKLELGIRVGNLNECIELCTKLEEAIYWKKLGDLALQRGEFAIAEQAFWSCEDLNSLLLIGSCLSNVVMLERVAEQAREKKHFSVAFTAFWVMGRAVRCWEVLVESERFGEAAIFAKTYVPSKIQEVYEAWKGFLKRKGEHLLLKRLENPLSTPGEYPEFPVLVEIENLVDLVTSQQQLPCNKYAQFVGLMEQLDFYEIAKNEGIDVLKGKVEEVYVQCKAGQDAAGATRQRKSQSEEHKENSEERGEGEGWEEVDIPE
jgi:hypothetical protein